MVVHLSIFNKKKGKKKEMRVNIMCTPDILMGML